MGESGPAPGKSLFHTVRLPDYARDLDLHPDGRRLALAFFDEAVRVYEMAPAGGIGLRGRSAVPPAHKSSRAQFSMKRFPVALPHRYG